MAMGDSFAYYWETQRYLESEELDRKNGERHITHMGWASHHVDHMDSVQMKQMVETALSQLVATGSPLSSMAVR
uniref:Uncharacterized protein n=1 Tax=Oryza brachyantha TaxID=4533 RepID=J3LWL2_ORYBR